jgi:hypothetical protein
MINLLKTPSKCAGSRIIFGRQGAAIIVGC